MLNGTAPTRRGTKSRSLTTSKRVNTCKRLAEDYTGIINSRLAGRMKCGMNFGNLSWWLWLLAALASGFMVLSGYSLLSWLWHLPERMPKMRGSLTLRHGDSELLRPPPKKLTAYQIAKLMLLAAAILGAYEIGTQSKYSKEYAAWKERSASYQKAYAAWSARQPQENK